MLKKIPLFTTILFIFLGPGLCLAGEGNIPIGHLRISQERIAKSGVLISRPSAIDEQIAAIVRQNEMQSIEDYSAWLKRTMIYIADGSENRWTEPDEFLRRKQGDCKDFASLNSRVLQVLGYQPRVMALTAPNSGHAICAFEYGGKLYWLDNAQLKSSNATTFAELAKELTEQLHYSQSFEVDLATKKTSLLYQRS